MRKIGFYEKYVKRPQDFLLCFSCSHCAVSCVGGDGLPGEEEVGEPDYFSTETSGVKR